ncbi:uncharacterized protein LOC126735232 [Anthonomus grandis grandis]|uniref:uncharacterized protein LOC126735232 n=1 Tax=Anthonomus grandis grandis TaxID=2921223 RepID=UPI00216615FF|nr:uncharacterized protein LOC126735232 [Anthonomus grandis grandis]
MPSKYLILLSFLVLLIFSIDSKPVEDQKTQIAEANNNVKDTSISEILRNLTFNPFSPDFKWINYNIAAVTTGTVIIIAGLAMVITIFFPIYAYKICYALGGCQNTLDQYVDRFIGVQGRTRRIKRREIEQNNDNMDFALHLLKMAMDTYSSKKENEEPYSNVMSVNAPSSNINDDVSKKIEKRSPLDYIAPILELTSRAYNEFVDSDLKKNFKKPPSIS